jgi:hypothetical protein
MRFELELNAGTERQDGLRGNSEAVFMS